VSTEREETTMPEKRTIERAKKDQAAGKAPSTQAGEFVREEMEHIREGKHGARSTPQAIAIGLSKARRSGVKLPPPKPGKTSETTQKRAARDIERGERDRPRGRARPSAKRSRATRGALERESHAAASRKALGKQARTAARRRTAEERSEAARKAARTKGPRVRKSAAKKAARTRRRPSAA
jgi:hypothetical protein